MKATPHPVYVAECDLGRGVFAASRLEKGERIFELAGPKISRREAIAMGGCEANPLQIDLDAYLDLRTPAVFLNHSCTPNVGVTVDCWLVALRDVCEGEELRYDYSTTMLERRWTMACKCGTRLCRNLIVEFDLLPSDRQRIYLDLKIVQPFIVRALAPA